MLLRSHVSRPVSVIAVAALMAFATLAHALVKVPEPYQNAKTVVDAIHIAAGENILRVPTVRNSVLQITPNRRGCRRVVVHIDYLVHAAAFVWHH